MVNEPYYYLSFWSEKPLEVFGNIEALKDGKWMMPEWNGAILKHSEILKARSATGQYELVKSFYNSGIGILLDYFKGGIQSSPVQH